MKTLAKNIVRHKLWRPEYLRKIVEDELGKRGEPLTHAKALDHVFGWIKRSFEATADGGSSAYYELGKGWQASYPETTGYLIPTLYDYFERTQEFTWRDLARRAGDWLLSIQSDEGGWQGLQVHLKAPLRVFNTAMIIDGLESLYRREGDKRFLEAAARGAKWVVTRADAHCNFSKDNHSSGGTFDSLVASSVLQVARHLPKAERAPLEAVARKALDNILALQTPSGWFKQCNTFADYEQRSTALLHHLGYTLEGLCRSATFLNEPRYSKSAEKAAVALRHYYEEHGDLPTDFLDGWRAYADRLFGRYALCLTGCSQIALVWMYFFRQTNDAAYAKAAAGITRDVAEITNRSYRESGMSFGVPGSFPIHGPYQTYQFVNWAAKYHADALLQIRPQDFN